MPGWQPTATAVATADPRVMFGPRRRLAGWLIAASVMLAFTAAMWLFADRIFYVLPGVALVAAGRAIAEYLDSRPRLS